MAKTKAITPEALITNDNCLCVVNTSGGKDSQAMSIYMQRMWVALGLDPKRLVFIHATLGTAEWSGVVDTIKSQITGDHDLNIVRANKSFLEMTVRSGKWPSPSFRQCTSDLKRAPIEKLIKRLVKEGKYEYVLDCMGMRAQESTKRSKLDVFKRKSNLCTTRFKREWYAWLPIHKWDIDFVFDYIATEEQNPFWVYGKGMTRCSCKLCIMSSKHDLYTSMMLDFENFIDYCAVERYLDDTFTMPRQVKDKKGNVIGRIRTFLPELLEKYSIKHGLFLPDNWRQMKLDLADDFWVMDRMIQLFPEGVPETKQEKVKRESLTTT